MKQYLTRKYVLLSSIAIIGVLLAFFIYKNYFYDNASSLNLNEKQQMDAVLAVLDQPTAVFDSSKGKLVTEEAPKMKPESKKKRDSIVVQQLSSSTFRGKSFEEIYKFYEAKVNEYLKTKDKKILSEIADFSNDPLFNGCKKMDNFKNKFNELEKKLNGNEEELY